MDWCHHVYHFKICVVLPPVALARALLARTPVHRPRMVSVSWLKQQLVTHLGDEDSPLRQHLDTQGFRYKSHTLPSAVETATSIAKRLPNFVKSISPENVTAFNELTAALLETRRGYVNDRVTLAEFAERLQRYVWREHGVAAVQRSTIESMFFAADVTGANDTRTESRSDEAWLDAREIKCALISMFYPTNPRRWEPTQAEAMFDAACAGSESSVRTECTTLHSESFSVAFLSIVALNKLLTPEKVLCLNFGAHGTVSALAEFSNIALQEPAAREASSSSSSSSTRGVGDFCVTKSQFCAWVHRVHGLAIPEAVIIAITVLNAAVTRASHRVGASDIADADIDDLDAAISVADVLSENHRVVGDHGVPALDVALERSREVRSRLEDTMDRMLKEAATVAAKEARRVFLEKTRVTAAWNAQLLARFTIPLSHVDNSPSRDARGMALVGTAPVGTPVDARLAAKARARRAERAAARAETRGLGSASRAELSCARTQRRTLQHTAAHGASIRQQLARARDTIAELRRALRVERHEADSLTREAKHHGTARPAASHAAAAQWQHVDSALSINATLEREILERRAECEAILAEQARALSDWRAKKLQLAERYERAAERRGSTEWGRRREGGGAPASMLRLRKLEQRLGEHDAAVASLHAAQRRLNATRARQGGSQQRLNPAHRSRR